MSGAWSWTDHKDGILRCGVSILEQQFWSGSVDITTSGQNHGDPELLFKDVQHVSYP